jgi:hypothetical protein
MDACLHSAGVAPSAYAVEAGPVVRPAAVESPLSPAEGSRPLGPSAAAPDLLARGHSTEQMADELGVSEHTVRNHVRAILHRLGVHSRLEAVIEAHERNLV